MIPVMDLSVCSRQVIPRHRDVLVMQFAYLDSRSPNTQGPETINDGDTFTKET